jgi:hypothetical protein
MLLRLRSNSKLGQALLCHKPYFREDHFKGGQISLLSYNACTLCFLSSFLDLRIELGGLATIRHPVLTDDPNPTMAQFAADYRLWYPPIGGGCIPP